MHIGGLMKKAFTLAEVLITLGIIGIVAAMTLPTVTKKISGIQYKTGYKRTLSALNQAINMNKAKYYFDFSSVTENCRNEKTDKASFIQSMCSIFNTNLTKTEALDYTKLYVNKNTLYYRYLYSKGVTSDTAIKEQGTQLYYYRLTDGSMFAFHSPHKNSSADTGCTLKNRTIEEAIADTRFQKYCIGWIDVNGVKNPNKEIRCSDNKAHYTDINQECTVEEITDVFPIVFYDSVVAPASAAARAILYN